MRIAVVTGRFPAWSVTFILDQITYALDHGCDVHVYASGPGEGAEHPEVHEYGLGSRIHYLPRSRQDMGRWRRGAAVWARILRHPRTSLFTLPHVHSRGELEDISGFLPHARFDVVHCHFASNAARILPALRSGVLRGKLLTTFHGYDVLHARPGAYPELFSSNAYYTANTNFLKRRAVELGAPEERIVRFPMGVRTQTFRPRARASETAGTSGLRLLTVARLVEFKGIEYGLRAFAQLRQEFPDCHYEIVGDGPLRVSLESLARELGVADYVHFMGAVARDGVLDAFARADVFVLPGVIDSRGQCEAQGVVLTEAQACSVPVVASRVGGIPEAVGEASATLVEPRNVPELVRELSALLRDPARRAAMAEAGPVFVAKSFDQDRLNAHLLAIYEAVAAGETPPRLS